jgi:hypothetical protein
METKNENQLRTKEENEILMNKILEGIEIYHKKLIAHKKRNNEKFVIMRDNQIITVDPEELE